MKNEEVSQTCFVFDVAKFKIQQVLLNCCVLTLSSSKTEEVSQNSFVFNLADRQIDRETTTTATTTTSTTTLHYYYNYQ